MPYITAIQMLFVAAGIILAIRGTRREFDGLMRPLRDPAKVETFFRGFRMSVSGLALIGIGVGWATGQTWLLVLSAAIGFEETLESTIQIWAVTGGKTFRFGPASRVPPAE